MKQQQPSPGRNEPDSMNPGQRRPNQAPQREPERERQQGQADPKRPQPDQPQPRPEDDDQH